MYKVSPCVKKGGGKISDPKKFEDIKPMLTHKNLLQNILPSGFDTAKSLRDDFKPYVDHFCNSVPRGPGILVTVLLL